MKQKNKFIVSLLVIIMILGLAATASAATKTYPDVDSAHWAYGNIAKLTELGGIEGNPDGKFYPDKSITRAEFVKIVVAVTLGEQEKSKVHWAENYIAKAEGEKLLTVGEFSRDTWDKPILRQEMAKVVSRAAEYLLKEDVITDTDLITAQITDWADTCGACKPYIAQAYGKGIIAGYPDGSFGGRQTASRAEASAMITRLIEPNLRLNAKPNEGVSLSREDFKEEDFGFTKVAEGTIPSHDFESPDITAYVAYREIADLPLTVDIDGNPFVIKKIEFKEGSLQVTQERSVAGSLSGQFYLLNSKREIYGSMAGGEYNQAGTYYPYGVPCGNNETVIATTKYILPDQIDIADYEWIILSVWQELTEGQVVDVADIPEDISSQNGYIAFRNPYYKEG